MLGATEAGGLELHTPEYERRIAETLAEAKPRPSRQDVLERAERRERIATQLAAGMLGSESEEFTWTVEGLARRAANFADALIAELDQREATELEEAR